MNSTIQVPLDDLFVTMVSMGYGKGMHNPVSELTTFYQPLKPQDSVMVVSNGPCDSSHQTMLSDTASVIDGHYAVGLIPTG